MIDKAEKFIFVSGISRATFFNYVRMLRKANGLKGIYNKPKLISDL